MAGPGFRASGIARDTGFGTSGCACCHRRPGQHSHRPRNFHPAGRRDRGVRHPVPPADVAASPSPWRLPGSARVAIPQAGPLRPGSGRA